MSSIKTEIHDGRCTAVIAGDCRDTLAEIMQATLDDSTLEIRNKLVAAEDALEHHLTTPTYMRPRTEVMKLHETVEECREEMWEQVRRHQRNITTTYWCNPDGIHLAVAVGIA